MTKIFFVLENVVFAIVFLLKVVINYEIISTSLGNIGLLETETLVPTSV